jgi:hypothetical protein
MAIKMKGRSPFNKPTKRKDEIYQLIVQVGGEARWKTLKAHLNELRLGPTTLKQALDEMVKEQSITKEARLGPDGAEVWYKLDTSVDEWATRNIDRTSEDAEYMQEMFDEIKKKAAKLNGKDKDEYLQAQMRKIIKVASETYIKFIGSFVRPAQFNDKAKLFQIFDYYFYYVLINDTKIFQNILSDYPSIGLKAIQSYLIKDKARLEKVMQAEEEYRKAVESNKTKAKPTKEKNIS